MRSLHDDPENDLVHCQDCNSPLYDDGTCPQCSFRLDDEPDIDEQQEWEDLPYGYDDDAGYRDEDRWHNGEYDS